MIAIGRPSVADVWIAEASDGLGPPPVHEGDRPIAVVELRVDDILRQRARGGLMIRTPEEILT